MKQIERLRSLMEKATPGPWSVWAEKIDGDRYAAISELTEQVQSTDPVGEHLYLLDAGGKCPATTGCGPQSWANANLIVEAVNSLPALLSHIDALEARVEEAEKNEEEAYDIGKRDGYSDAVQRIDIETGGDGEYRYCLGNEGSERHCPDPGTMKMRIQERFAALAERAEAAERALAEAVGVLGDISNPIRALQREASAEGRKLSGAAYAIANDLHFVQGLARAFLTKMGEK